MHVGERTLTAVVRDAVRTRGFILEAIDMRCYFICHDVNVVVGGKFGMVS